MKTLLYPAWARIEVAGGKTDYQVPPARQDYAGLLVSLAKQEHPDTSAYTDSDIVWRMDKANHVGFIVRSDSHAVVEKKLGELTERVTHDFWAYAAPKEKPTS